MGHHKLSTNAPDVLFDDSTSQPCSYKETERHTTVLKLYMPPLSFTYPFTLLLLTKFTPGPGFTRVSPIMLMYHISSAYHPIEQSVLFYTHSCISKPYLLT